jgi:predicted secreted protein
MIWVVVLFLVLPWGVRLPERAEPGHADSAPDNPQIGLKLLVTCLLSGLLWVVAFLTLRV